MTHRTFDERRIKQGILSEIFAKLADNTLSFLLRPLEFIVDAIAAWVWAIAAIQTVWWGVENPLFLVASLAILITLYMLCSEYFGAKAWIYSVRRAAVTYLMTAGVVGTFRLTTGFMWMIGQLWEHKWLYLS